MKIIVILFLSFLLTGCCMNKKYKVTPYYEIELINTDKKTRKIGYATFHTSTGQLPAYYILEKLK